MFCFFFFQAEDGIRDADVTGVQTCALPISNLGALVGREVLYVDRADSSQALRWQLGVGSRVPVHCSALGKAILASLPEAEVAEHLPRRLRRITPNTIT